MTDDEVVRPPSKADDDFLTPEWIDRLRTWLTSQCYDWLSGDEHEDCYDACKDEQVPLMMALCALAETRKALWSLEWAESDGDGHCNICTKHGRHAPDCIFATMPRPKA